MTPAQLNAAARALHRFNAPRVGNDVEAWEYISPASQARWLKMATLAFEAAALVASREAETPVVEAVTT